MSPQSFLRMAHLETRIIFRHLFCVGVSSTRETKIKFMQSAEVKEKPLIIHGATLANGLLVFSARILIKSFSASWLVVFQVH